MTAVAVSDAALWAIGDLHLPGADGRTMERFGDHWSGHVEKIEAAWRATVGADDWVVLTGDLSWARHWEQAQADLRRIDAWPGRKLVVRGNHDLWWARERDDLAGRLPATFTIVDRRLATVRIGGRRVHVGGLLGQVYPGDPFWRPQYTRLARRSIECLTELLGQFQEAREAGDRCVLVSHYPLYTSDGKPTDASAIVESSGIIDLCVYGHLHMEAEWAVAATAATAVRGGVDYRLTSADYLDFRPVRVM